MPFVQAVVQHRPTPQGHARAAQPPAPCPPPQQGALRSAACLPPIAHSFFSSDDDPAAHLAQAQRYALLDDAEAATSPTEALHQTVAARASWLQAHRDVSELPERDFLSAADAVDALAALTLAVHAPHGTVSDASPMDPDDATLGAALRGAAACSSVSRPASVVAPLAAMNVPRVGARGVWECTRARGSGVVRAVQPGRPVNFTPYNREQARLREEARQKRLAAQSDSD
jgi:hypothetical protein